MRRLVFISLLVLTLLVAFFYYEKDETISGFTTAEATWHLTELNGQVFVHNATLSFPKSGVILGNGPCNAFSTTQTAPYPWFEVTPISATKMACGLTADEQVFFVALENAAYVEISGDTLILSNDTGPTLVFKSR